MKQLIRIITLVLLFQFSFAKLNDALIVQLQRHYRTADFKVGLQKTKEEIRSAERKKDSVKQVRLAVLYGYQALFQKSISKEKEYLLSLGRAKENLLASAPGPYFSIAYSSLIEALLLDLRVSEATSLSNLVQDKLNACTALNGVPRDQILLAQWKIQFANGNYKMLLSDLTARSGLLLNTITMRDSVRVRSKMKVEKLPATEVRSRKNRYSESIQLLAKTYLNNGFADSALSILIRHEGWLKKELSYQEGAMANTLFLIAQTYDMLDQRSKTLDYVRKASGASLKFFAQHAPIRIEIQELHINTLIASERYEEANVYNNDLDVKVLGYYGKSSFGYHRNRYIDIEHLLLNHAWKKAERELTAYNEVKNFYPVSHPFRLKSGKDLFRMYVRNNKLQEAEKVLDTLLELARVKYGVESPNYHIFLLEKATYHSEYTDKFSESENEFASGLTALKKDVAPTHPDFLYFRHREAELLLETEKFESAEKKWNEVLDDLSKFPGEQSLPYAVALSHVVAYDVIAGKYTQADTRIKKAVSILEKTESEKYKTDLIHCLETASRLAIIQGDFMGANKLILQAAKILKKSDGETSTAAFEELTRLNIYFGKYQRTEEDLYEMIALREKRFGKSHRSLRSPLNQLAYLKIVTGAFTEAEEMLQRAAGIAKQVYGDQSIKLTETLMLQRQLYTVAGDYEKAQAAIETAVEITIKKFGKEHVRVGILLHELALARFLSTGSLEAKNVLVTAPEEGGSEKTRAIKDNDKKKRKKNDEKKAVRRNSDLPAEPEPLLSLSINTIKNGLGDNTPALAEALENAAIYHLSKGNYELAIQNSGRAMDIWNTQLTEKNLRSAKLLTLQGSVLQAQGNYPLSLANYQKAMELFKNIFDDNHPDYVATLGKCAQLHYINNHTKEAIQYSTETIDKSLVYIDKIFPGLSERGKAAYWEKAKNDFDFFKTLAIVNADKNPELLGKLMDMQIKTKAILLNSSIKVKKRIMSSGDSTLIGNYQRWQSLRENLATALSMSAEQRKESGTDANKIQDEIEQLERKLSAGSEVFAKNYDQSAYSWETLKKTLAPGELFIEVVPFRYFNKKFTDTTWYAFLFVNHNTKGHPDYAVIKDGHLLAGRYLRYYRNCVRFESTDEYSYSKFWEPIQPHIPAQTKTILFDADGAYNQLNVEAFPTPEGKYLLDKYNIVLVGTARDVIDASVKEKVPRGRTSAGFVFVGNPIYYQSDFNEEKSVPQLDGAEQEVRAINEHVVSINKTTSMMLNQEATESKVKELQYPEVFHIATHGFFLTDVADESSDEFSEKAVQNPLLRSGLLLQKGGQILQVENLYAINREDGVLTAYEAMNLNFDNTKLVVLSACETGLGEVKIGEGVYGLQRSFLVAGAQSIVMSLFKVNDEVTKMLMLEFYKRWQKGESKRDAFANAKREVMKTYPAPKYWASFIMIGVN